MGFGVWRITDLAEHRYLCPILASCSESVTNEGNV
jgi:hypothetical protein